MEEEIKKKAELTCKLQSLFKSFYLAGGTALMIKFKHRVSIDIDLFSKKEFSFSRLAVKMRKFFDIEKEIRGTDNIDFYLEGTKVSFVYFPFKNIKRVESVGCVKKASDYDIFLNKIYAAGRRIEPKDPYDVGFLYKIYKESLDITHIKRDFETKFPGQVFEIYLGALLSFDDYPQLPEWIKNELLELEQRLKIN